MHLWWGGGGEQVHNVDYDPVKTVCGGGGEQREQRKSKRERGDVYTTRVQMALTLAVGCELAVKSRPPPPNPPQPVEISITTQQYGPNTTVWALDSPHLPLHKITY